MCGLAGELRWDAPPDEARVRRMSAALAHRGPDGDGVYVTAHACLASRRLALRDIANGAQPMSSPDGRWHLVFNGEIDNAEALRRRYEDRWTFRTRCDTEVLLAALALDGESVLLALDGMFAFCLWDAQTQEALLARDRLGIKPLVFSVERGFLFASECKALLAGGVRPVADLDAIAEVMTAAPFSVRAPFSGMEVLKPGSLLRVRRDGTERARWWTPRVTGVGGACVDDLRRELGEAVRGALVADVPVGLFLSGGLDSTLLAALAHEVGVRLPSYTMAFDDQTGFDWNRSRIVVADDEPYANMAAERYGLARTLCRAARDEEALWRVAVQDDLLPAWEQEVSQDVLARHAARDVKAVLVGDAADETHYGYHFLLDEAALCGPEAILPRFGVAPLRAEHRIDFAARYRVELATAGHGWGSLDERRRAMTHLVVTRWLPRLLSNGDLHTMAHGLEARVPFGKPALVELALSVAPAVALEGGVEKALLRRMARGLVPEEIVARRKSALPKDLASEALYRRVLPSARRRAPELFETLFDPVELDALSVRAWTEADRAVAFRLIALSHWAAHYEVRV
ncbi:MAG: asparagine synthase (glutamine-hydrolyzing) [Polyangia bacterium]